jgi:hypothetical protein
MTLRRRLLLLACLMLLALATYAAGRYYSTSLVVYVVEQTLIQKAPVDMDSTSIRKRYRAWLADAPNSEAKMQALLSLSRHIEGVQFLTSADLEMLLGKEKAGTQTPELR